MPTRPIPDQDARKAILHTWLPPEWNQPVDDLRGDQALSGWLWDTITAALGITDETRRETPRRRHKQQRGERTQFVSVAVSPRVDAAIEEARGGLTVSEWIRETVRLALAEAGKLPDPAPSPPPVAADTQPDHAKAAAIGRLEQVDWPEDPAARNEKIRQLDADGKFDGLSYADIAHVIPGNLTRQRVHAILKQQKEEQ